MSRIDKLLDEYVDTFHKNFPYFMTNLRGEEEIDETIEKCLKEGKEYEVEDDGPDVMY